MLIGAMNHPGKALVDEIDWIGKAGFDFIDLTLEPPGAAAWEVDPNTIRKLLEDHNLRIVGHTPPYLPIASPFESLRKAAIVEFRRCVEVFQILQASWMNLHPSIVPMHKRGFSVERNLASLQDLLPTARQTGVGLMIENVPGAFNNAAQLGELLGPLPDVGLHLDIGHCNLMNPTNTEREIVEAYGSRLRHVHLHDNRGGDLDLHLPLGSGNIDIEEALRILKRSGYDGTITLEVFAGDFNQLLRSRDVLTRAWGAA
jgi:sugar phosphate isomerase/epimerase